MVRSAPIQPQVLALIGLLTSCQLVTQANDLVERSFIVW